MCDRKKYHILSILKYDNNYAYKLTIIILNMKITAICHNPKITPIIVIYIAIGLNKTVTWTSGVILNPPYLYLKLHVEGDEKAYWKVYLVENHN